MDSQRIIQLHLDNLSAEDDDEYDLMVSDLLFSESPKVEPAPRREQINQNRVAGDMRLMDDYFKEGAEYKKKFERRYRMSRDLFERIAQDLQAHNKYWVQRKVSWFLKKGV